MRKLFFIITIFFAFKVQSQNVGIGTASPELSAQLEVSSTSKGFLPPRMTAAERTGISSPVNGLLVYQTDYPSGLYYFNSGAWSGVAVQLITQV